MDIWIDRHSERYTHGQTRHALYLYRILCLLKSKTSKHLTSFYTSPYIACCLVSAHLVFIATLLVHFHYFSAHQKKYVPDRNKDLQLTDPRTHRWTHPNGVLYFQTKNKSDYLSSAFWKLFACCSYTVSLIQCQCLSYEYWCSWLILLVMILESQYCHLTVLCQSKLG